MRLAGSLCYPCTPAGAKVTHWAGLIGGSWGLTANGYCCVRNLLTMPKAASLCSRAVKAQVDVLVTEWSGTYDGSAKHGPSTTIARH